MQFRAGLRVALFAGSLCAAAAWSPLTASAVAEDDPAVVGAEPESDVDPGARAPRIIAPSGGPVALERVADFGIESGSACSVDWSRDGKTIAVGGSNGDVVLVDAAAHSARAAWHPFDNQVDCVAIAPDGKRVAAIGPHGALLLLDVATRRRVASAAGGPWCRWTPDGKSLVHTDPNAVLLRDPATLKIVRTMDVDPADGTVDRVAVSPDGRTIAAGTSGGAVWTFVASSGRMTSHDVAVKGKRIVGVGFVQGGRAIAAAADGTVWTRVSTWSAGEEASSMEVSPKGTAVVVRATVRGLKRTVRIDVRTGTKTVLDDGTADASSESRWGPQGWVGGFAWSPDGASCAEAGDRCGLTVFVGEGRWRADVTAGPVWHASFDPGGRFVAASGRGSGVDGVSALFDTTAGRAVRVRTGRAIVGAGTRPGEFCGWPQRWVVWDAESGRATERGEAADDFLPTWTAPSVAPGGAAAIVQTARALFVVDTATGAVRRHVGVDAFCAVWLPGGRRVALSATPPGFDGPASWSMATLDGLDLKLAAPPASAPADATPLAVAPSGKRLALRTPHGVVEIDPDTGVELRAVPAKFHWLRYVSEDAAIGRDGPEVSWWDCAAGKVTPLVRGVTDVGTDLSPDGTLLAVATPYRVWLYRLTPRK